MLVQIAKLFDQPCELNQIKNPSLIVSKQNNNKLNKNACRNILLLTKAYPERGAGRYLISFKINVLYFLPI